MLLPNPYLIQRFMGSKVFGKCEHCGEELTDKEFFDSLVAKKDGCSDGNLNICCPKCGKETSIKPITQSSNGISSPWSMLLA